jgi:uncharacterized protein
MILNHLSRGLAAAVPAAAAALLYAACATPHGALLYGNAECALPYTQVGTIQGAAMATQFAGQTVTTQGVVVADFEGPAPALRGFYLQDVRGDGNATTSDGIFIYNGDRDDVAVGDLVRVTGVAGEERAQTQLAAAAIVACGTASVSPADVLLPVTSATYLERYEGMLVRLPQTLYVTEHYQLGRFGEVVLSSGGRLPQPTSVASPGAAAQAVQAANDLNRITLADASYEQNPSSIVFGRAGAPLSADNTLRGGDHVTGIIGVLTQTSAAGTSASVAYRVRPVQSLHGGVPAFVAANQRPSVPPDVGGTLRVASFNLLNYFNTFTGCTAGVGGAAVECRGAQNETEFERQWRKTVAAVVAMAPDILGIIEVENDGYGPHSAIADLVGRLNAATEPGRYAFIDADAGTAAVNALGTDAIKVGLVYRPARVSPVGHTAALNTTVFVNGGESGPRSRPSLAQAFRQPDGGSVVVSINHLKSKGSGCDVPDAGDGQGACNAARTVAARELAAWLAGDPTGTGEANILILGDLNAYAREDPVAALAEAGYRDLVAMHATAAARVGGAPYSYVFNGQWGALDYALAAAALVPQVTGAAAWHINADEPPVLDFGTRFKSDVQRTALYRPDPFRSSDHDPIIVGLRLRTPGG